MGGAGQRSEGAAGFENCRRRCKRPSFNKRLAEDQYASPDCTTPEPCAHDRPLATTDIANRMTLNVCSTSSASMASPTCHSTSSAPMTNPTCRSTTDIADHMTAFAAQSLTAPIKRHPPSPSAQRLGKATAMLTLDPRAPLTAQAVGGVAACSWRHRDGPRRVRRPCPCTKPLGSKAR